MNDPDDEKALETRRRVGSLLIWLGALTAILIVIDRSGLGILSMPGFWYRSRSLHLVACIGLFVAGGALLRTRPDSDEGADVPIGTNEPAIHQVRFYSRKDCPLCDDAREVLDRYQQDLPAIEFVDIAGNAELEEQHGEWIPVVEIDGRVRFRGRVDPVLLERLIDARNRAAGDREPGNPS